MFRDGYTVVQPPKAEVSLPQTNSSISNPMQRYGQPQPGLVLPNRRLPSSVSHNQPPMTGLPQRNQPSMMRSGPQTTRIEPERTDRSLGPALKGPSVPFFSVPNAGGPPQGQQQPPIQMMGSMNLNQFAPTQQVAPPPTTAFAGGMRNTVAPPPTGAEIRQMVSPPPTGMTGMGAGPSSMSMGMGMGMRSGMGGMNSFNGPPASVIQEIGDYDQNDDARNCSTKFIRATCSCFPGTNALRLQSKIPVGVVVQPMSVSDEDIPLTQPVVQDNTEAVIRCQNCRAYMNPFFDFENNRQYFKCCFCGTTTASPMKYQTMIGASADDEHAELNVGSYEILAPREFMQDTFKCPNYLFVIDVTKAAVSSGLTKASCEGIANCIEDLENMAEKVQVGIICFDKKVYMMNMQENLSQFQQMVCPDIDTPQVPLPSGFICDVKTCKSNILDALEAIPRMYAETQITESALGAAVQLAGTVLFNTQGRILLFAGGRPSAGLGACEDRASSMEMKLEGAESKLLESASDFYPRLGQELCMHNINCDVILGSQMFADAGSLGSLAHAAASQFYYHPGFIYDIHKDLLCQDIKRILTREQGHDCVLRVRVSKGFSVGQSHGSILKRENDLVTLGTCHSDTVVTLEIRNDEAIQDLGKYVYIQSALLYTTKDLERRLRISTTRYPIGYNESDLIRNVDCDAMCCYVAKAICGNVVKRGTGDARQVLEGICRALIQTSVRVSHSSKEVSQILPSIRYFPLYTLGIKKSALFRSEPVFSDERAAMLARIQNMGPDSIRLLAFPNMFPLHVPINDNKFSIPMSLSMSQLSLDGVYLIIEPCRAFVLYGPNVDPMVMNDLFGPEAERGDHLQFIRRDNLRSQKAHDVLEESRAMLPYSIPVWVVSSTEEQCKMVAMNMIEDATGTDVSYQDFMKKVMMMPGGNGGNLPTK
eukprot:TRINITY_DN2589_c0_g1_i1.p1 TRINITY_DN2589_c0_g1~~TRINITY_DN2589_c0_g1_i1.p1  ORF type:complete len:933 (-),score=272.08 TRINITY_DN2589_c0_g1_i1:273-3071(-)